MLDQYSVNFHHMNKIFIPIKTIKTAVIVAYTCFCDTSIHFEIILWVIIYMPLYKNYWRSISHELKTGILRSHVWAGSNGQTTVYQFLFIKMIIMLQGKDYRTPVGLFIMDVLFKGNPPMVDISFLKGNG